MTDDLKMKAKQLGLYGVLARWQHYGTQTWLPPVAPR